MKSRLLAAGCALVAFGTQAPALDQNRALTQSMHRVWQSEQGIPLASIRAIRQAADGYLWLGTESGLFRFDGVRFVAAADLNPRLAPDAAVTALAEDESGNLWISARNGLFRMRNGAVELAGNAAGCLIADPRHGVWACTADGLVAGSARLGMAEGLPRDAAQTGCVTSDGRIWVGGPGSRIYVWDGQRFTPRPLRGLPAQATVQTMLAARDGTVWIGTSDGLIQLSDKIERRLTTADGLPANSVRSLTEGRDGTLWIGTTAGFSRLRKNDIESYTTKAGLSQSTINAIFEDSQGSLWVGTKRGLNQFFDRHTIPITTSEGLPSNDTGPIFQDARGTLWVGTIGAGLARYEGRLLSVMTTANGLASNTIRALAGRENELWVGTDRGLNRLRDGVVAETWTEASGLPSKTVSSLYAAPDGSTWVGTSRGLAVLRDGKMTRVAPDAVVSLAGDGHGRVYAALSERGVAAFDSVSGRELAGERLAVHHAVALYSDGARLWVGTLGGGLVISERGRLTAVLPKDGLFDDEIFGMAPDGGGLLWMACSKGIFSVRVADLLEFAAGRSHQVKSNPYSPLDGLQTVECKSGVQPAVWHMRDGHVSFSTIRGLLLMDPVQTFRPAVPPRAVIEQIVVNGRVLGPDALQDLHPGNKNVDFIYTGLDFRSPGRITFEYMLEGFTRGWVAARTRREASFTNLTPGRYRFRLKACTTAGGCSETAGPELVIPARYYQRVWFPFAAGGLLLGTVWLAYLARIRSLKKHFDAILGERLRIARELHDTLLQGFSGVTMEMQALAARLPGESKAVLDDIIADAAKSLREVRLLVSNLRNEQHARAGLSSALAQAVAQASGGARVKLELEDAPALPAEVEYNLARIAQEAATNAVKHSGADHIRVRLRSGRGRVSLSVADDGCGFTPEGAFDGHFGLLGMKERAAEIGADLDVSSRPGKGTTVSVALELADAARVRKES